MNPKAFSVEGKVTIGRSSSCKIRVKDFDVSRVHAEVILREGDKVMIRDLQSKNGTLVNNNVIEEVELQPGDEAKIGNTIFVCIKESGAESEGIDYYSLALKVDFVI